VTSRDSFKQKWQQEKEVRKELEEKIHLLETIPEELQDILSPDFEDEKEESGSIMEEHIHDDHFHHHEHNEEDSELVEVKDGIQRKRKRTTFSSPFTTEHGYLLRSRNGICQILGCTKPTIKLTPKQKISPSRRTSTRQPQTTKRDSSQTSPKKRKSSRQ